MNIKSLLLGSAAALVAVSGARAADVIVPAAEPAEYVKVCDVYGTGFYYIPGTETCIQISGYVRFKYEVIGDTIDNEDGDDYASGSNTRVRLNFDVREETELGTLRAFARVQATNNGIPDNRDGGGDASYAMDLGYIQLGGLTMGYLDSLWKEGSGLLTDTDSIVGDIQTNRVSYTASFGAFSVAGSVEDDGGSNFTPNGILRVAYESDLFSAFLAGSIDGDGSIYNDDFGGFDGFLLSDDGDSDDGAVALKAGISFKPVQDGELKFEGSYAFDPSVYSTLDIFDGVATTVSVGGFDFATAVNGTLPVEWQVGAGYAQQFGKLGVAVSGLYGETFDYYTFTGGSFENLGSGEYWRVVGNVGYEITNNFDVLGEVRYTNIDLEDDSVNQTAGFVQFVRSF